jgi:hypothetical protein
MKQTAVEWLISNIVEDQSIKCKSMTEWIEIFTKAKEMEKKQIIDAHTHGFSEGLPYGMSPTGYKFMSAEEYFNETFKSK